MQFEVFQNPNRAGRAEAPYVVVVQHDATIGAQTVVVAPLVRRVDVSTDDRLVVPAIVGGEAFVVLLASMSAIAKRGLQTPVAAVPELSERLPRAIDALFLGL